MPNSPETNQHALSVAEQISEPPKIEIRERINRADLLAEKEKIFLFGDNLAERRLGGQAREMRGEENAVGIPTKKAPDNRPASFFTDKELAENKRAIDAAFGKIPPDKIIVIPKAGIGTGLAQLAEKAPQTFAYLNEKFAGIGFDNERGRLLIVPKTVSQNKTSNVVVVQSNLENPPAEKRLLDLNDIKTAELIALAPSRAEAHALGTNRTEALAEYADRLRQDYKENKNGLREGFKILSDTLDRGGQITVSCACRAGSKMCHADVVKMAVEKVNVHLKNQQTQEKSEILAPTIKILVALIQKNRRKSLIRARSGRSMKFSHRANTINCWKPSAKPTAGTEASKRLFWESLRSSSATFTSAAEMSLTEN